MHLLLLLFCAPLVAGACPKVLEGVDKSLLGYSLRECIDVACGRKTFSYHFWSMDVMKELMKLMAADAIIQNATLCNQDCIETLDEKYDIRELAPLAQSARASFDAIDNAEAKANVQGLFNSSFTYRLFERSASNNFVSSFDESSDSRALRFAHLSAGADVAILRATKRTFGIQDSAEQNSEYIATALSALRNAKLPRDSAEIAALIEKTQKLLEKNYWFRDRFYLYAINVRMHDNEWIRAVEILPAAETLYLQYLKLDNKEAKEYIDSFLKSLKEHYDKSEPTVIQDLWNGKHKQTTSDLGLSHDAASTLESTFPELFQYLYKNDYIVKKSLGTF